MTQSSSDKKPLTIVFYTDFFHPSLEGVTASVSLFADALRRLGHRVYVVAPAPARKYHLDHPDVIRLPSMKSVWHKDMRDGIMTPRSAKYIKSLKADIYHFHTNGPTGLGGMRLMFDLHIPSVATYHTDYEQYSKVYPRLWAGLLTGSLIGPMIAKAPVHSWPESLSGMKPKRTFKEWNDNMIHNLIRVSYEFIEHVIVPSEKMARMLRSYGVSRPITILPTGINPSDFPSKKPRKSPSTTKHLLYVGRIAREKNIDVLINMMKILSKKQQKYHLTLVGPGPYLSATRQKIREVGLTTIIDTPGGMPREQAYTYYAQADAFVFPSMTDTQALVLNEAAYSCVPLLFSDKNISIVAKHNVTGLCIRPTGKAYAEAVETLLINRELASQYGKEAHRLAQSITIDRQAKQLARLYQEVIREHYDHESA